MSRTAIVLAILVAIVGLVGYGAVFSVHETQQALVLQFGEPVREIREPGLQFKIPFAQNVVYMENRILDLDSPQEEIVASDKRRLVVDAYSRWRIVEPLLFYQRVRDEETARARLSAIVNSTLRQVLATVSMQAVLSGERGDLMRRISEQVNTEARTVGIEMVDVRIKRADLPEENSQAIYRRMQAEREREAREARARGAEEAQKIRADADRQVTVLLAEAQKQADILRGQGDGRRQQIFVEAFKSDPEFFSFYRSMQAYRNALGGDGTTMVLSPDSDFFQYFGNSAGGGGVPQERPESQ